MNSKEEKNEMNYQAPTLQELYIMPCIEANGLSNFTETEEADEDYGDEAGDD